VSVGLTSEACASTTAVPHQKTSADPPRKTRLRQKLKASQLRCRRLTQRVRMRNSAKCLHRRKSDHLNELRNCLTPVAYTLLSAQVCLHDRRAKKWTDNERMIALALHYQSPKSYRFLRHVFRLPAASSLRRWVQHMRLEPGMNEHLVNSLHLCI